MSYPKLIDNIAIKRRNDLYLFINPANPSWFFGKGDALKVMEKCNGKNSIQDIVLLLSKETGESVEELQKAVPKFIKNIEKLGFFKHGKKIEVRELQFSLETVYLRLTNACNLRCSHCYLNAGNLLDNELRKEEVFSVIGQMKELANGKTQVLTCSGGEPLLREDIWDIAEYARTQGVMLSLITNAVLIDEHMAKNIKRHFNSVSVSLDGLKETNDKIRGKGSFDLIISGLENLIAVGMSPMIGTTITKENLADVPQLVYLLKKYGLKYLGVEPVIPIGRANTAMMPSNEEYIRLVRELHKIAYEEQLDIDVNCKKYISLKPLITAESWGCGAAVSYLSIDSDGSVYPCLTTNREVFRAGNIREQSLKDIWMSKVMKEWREITADTIPECLGCLWKRFCGGACKSYAYIKYNTIQAPDIFCDAYSTLFEDMLWKTVNDTIHGSL